VTVAVLSRLILTEAGPILPGFSWGPDTSRYRNGETGRFVARKDILGLLSASTNANEESMRAGVLAYHSGELDQATFLARTTTMLRREYLQNTALGSGGWDRLGPVEWGRIGGRLRSEYAYLRGFAQEIADGTVSAAQAAARMQSYVGGARHEFFRAERENKAPAEMGKTTLERRVLSPEAKHCRQCPEYAALGWQPAGELPLPTEECDCRNNCLCSVQTKTVAADAADEVVGTGGGRVTEFDPDQARDEAVAEGGEGSGNFGHAGRPGEIGGSAPEGGGGGKRGVKDPGVVAHTLEGMITVHMDAVERRWGDREDYNREQSTARWRKNWAGVEAAPETIAQVQQGVQRAVDNNQAKLIPVVVRQATADDSKGVIAEYNDSLQYITVFEDPHGVFVPTPYAPGDEVYDTTSLYVDQDKSPESYYAGVYAHEYGHHFTITVVPEIRTRADREVNSWDDNQRKWVSTNVSCYATANGMELAAECYSLRNAPGYERLPGATKTYIARILEGV